MQFSLLRRLARSPVASIRSSALAAFRDCLTSQPAMAAAYARLVVYPGLEEVAPEATGVLVTLLQEAGIAAAGRGKASVNSDSFSKGGKKLAASIGLAPEQWASSVQPTLMEAAVKMLTGTAQPGTAAAAAAASTPAPTAADAAALAPLFGTATADQVTSLLLPALGKGLKSRTDGVLPLAHVVLTSLTTDVSKGVEEHLLPTLLSAASNGTKDEARAHAAELARAVGAHTADPAVLGKVLTGLSDIIVKKKATVPLWQSRFGLTKAVEALVAGAASSVVGLPLSAAAKLAGDAAAMLVAAVPKETHDGVRVTSVAALGAALAAQAYTVTSEGKAPFSLPSDVSSALAKGLASCAPVTGAGAPPPAAGAGVALLGDGWAEAVFTVVTAGAAVTADGVLSQPTVLTPASEAAACAVTKCGDIVTALLDMVAKAGNTYLASKKPLSPGTLANVAFSIAALVRLARVDPAVADRMSGVKMSADAPAGGAGAGAAGTKPAATSAAAAKPGAAKPAAGAKAAAPAAAAVGLGALPAKTYDAWDALTSPALAPHLLWTSALASPAGKTKRELASLAAVTSAIAAAVFGALAWHSDVSFKPYPKAYVSAVLADLKGETAGDARADVSGPQPSPTASAPSKAVAPAAGAEPEAKPSPKKASPLFVGLVSLLAHPLASIRQAAAAGVKALYATSGGVHSALPQCLLHALADRIRAHESVVTHPSLGSEGAPCAFDTGIGHGPVATNALASALEENGGRLSALKQASASSSSDASGSASGDVSGSIYGALPPPHLLQAALLALFATSSSSASLGVIDSEACLPTAVFLCCHPAVVGGPVDACRRSGVNAGLGVIGGGAETSAGAADAAITAPETGKHGRAIAALWRRVYTCLVKSAGLIPALTPASNGEEDASNSNSNSNSSSGKKQLVTKTVALTPASLDVLLQRASVTSAISAHILGRNGLWSPCHASRLTSARVLGLLMRGTGWMTDRKSGVASPALSRGFQKKRQDASASADGAITAAAGARPYVIHTLLPLLLSSLRGVTSVVGTLTSEDLLIWRTPDGVPAPSMSDAGEVGMWHGDLAGQSHAPHMRAARVSKRGNRMAEAEEDAWVAQLKEEMAAKKAAEEAAAAKAKQASALKAAAASAGKGGAAVAAKAGGAKPGAPAVPVEDPLVAKIREQAITRAKVQALYSAAVATLAGLTSLLSASPAATQPLLPQVLPALLPSLACELTSPHAGLAVAACIRAAASNTVLQSPEGHSLPQGLVGDWTRALTIVMLAQAQAAASSASAGSTSVTGPGKALLAVPKVVAAFKGPDVTSISAPLPLTSGGILGACVPVLRRLLAVLCPACLPEGSYNKGLLSGESADADHAVGRGGSRDGDEDAEVATGTRVRRPATPRPLPPSSFTALFPVLHAILTASPPLPLLQPALSLLSAHVILPTRVASRVDPVWATGGEATYEDGAADGSGSGTGGIPPAVAGVVTLNLSRSVSYAVPLGPCLADGAASTDAAASSSTADALDASGGSAGVRWAAAATAALACCVADAPHTVPAAALRSSSSTASADDVDNSDEYEDASAHLPVGTGTPDSDYFALRLLREPLAGALLHVLRAAPRTVPSPSEVLTKLVRGAPDSGAAASSSSREEGSRRGSRRSSGGSSHHSDDEETEEEETHDEAAAAGSPTSEPLLHTFTLSEASPLVSAAGLLSPFSHVRATCLSGLDAILSVHSGASGLAAVKAEDVEWAAAVDAAAAGEAGASGISITALKASTLASAEAKNVLLSRLWVAVHDADEDNAAHGELLWSRHGCKLSDAGYAAPLIALLSHSDESVRGSAARAIAGAAVTYPATTDVTLRQLTDTLMKALPEEARMTSASSFTRPMSFEPSGGASAAGASAAATAVKTRCGVLAALGSLAEKKALPVHTLPIVVPFIIQRGLPDVTRAVVDAAVASGRAVVDAYGETHVKLLLPVLEGFLEKGAASPLAAPGETGRDQQREGCVVLLGACAAFLPPTDPKVDHILRTLLDTLNTPSESVQRAVAGCLPPLAKGLKERGTEASGDVLSLLLGRLLESPSFAIRRGAAFGLAACVKGLGLTSLKQHNLLAVLEEAANDKSEAARQGAAFAYETLCESLGILFEPYVIRILPTLLKCCGDPSEAVREAAGVASKAVMGMLTGHGVKLVLPAVLGGLSDSAWRSKVACISMLGSMAYCAPKQLGQALPSIVPKLAEAFEDPHPKVQAATREALAIIGNVIRNPEVAKLVPVLLGALTDPADKTPEALFDLSHTDFVHAIDPASLALIVPILKRGLADRSTYVKGQAAGIVGSMCSLVGEPRDLLPYLPVLVPVLRKAVTDPIPDTRAVAARALGRLMSGVGEEHMPDLLPWLVDTMRGESGSTVERSGAAQAIAEVLCSVGPERIGAFTMDLLPLATAPKPPPREGFLWLLTFLPSSLGSSYASLLPHTFPVVLDRLSDDSEVVRDVALRAGSVTVRNFARSDAKLLGPPLESALMGRSWRIRLGACTLTGNLLNEIAGQKGAVVVAGNTMGGGLPDQAEEDFVEDEYASEEESDDDSLGGGMVAEDSESESEDEAPPVQAKASPTASAPKADLPPSKGGKGAKGGDFYGKKAEKPKAEQGRKKLTPEEIEARDRSNKRGDRIAAAAAAVRGGGGGGSKPKAGAQPASKLSEKERAEAERRRAEAMLVTSSLAAMDAAGRAQAQALGLDGRRALLAALYATRCDVSAVVRQAGMKVWKDCVANTPKTLREILPAIMRQVITALADTDNEERRVVAGRTLGDVVRKLGDRVLPEIVPILRRGLESPSAATRQGVCSGLAEVIEAASKDQIEGHVAVLIPAVRDALCDVSPGVREAAARAFNTLTHTLGHGAVEATVPSLLAAMDTDDAEASARAMAGLQSIVALRSKEILPSLLPKLVAHPLSLFHARALAGVAGVVSGVLHYHLLSLLPSLVASLAGEEPLAEPSPAGPPGSPEAIGDLLAGPLGAACAATLAAVDDSGVAWTIGETSKYLTDPSPARRRVAAWLLGQFISLTKADITTQLPVLVKELIGQLADPDEHALKVSRTVP